jgi:hypothetical protein
MNHPNAMRLEAFAAGERERDEAVVAHLGECAACQAYVERARTLGDAPPLDVDRLVGRVAPAPAPRAQRFALVASSVLVPLCIAAGVLLWVVPRSAPSASALASPSASEVESDPETTFKGGLQVAVIRERDGAQKRFVGSVSVRPGDRLRVEVALDRTQTILGAVLGDDGSYLEIMPGVARGAGTHFSESSAKVDAQPLRGVVLVGPAEAVRQARVTHRLGGLATVPIEWEAP